MEQYFIYVGAGLGILSFILIIMDHFRLNSVIKKYRKLIRGLSEKNVEDLMVSYAEELDKIKQNMSNNIEKRLSTMEQKLPSCLRNTGMVTYNAFDNIGNNMSFQLQLWMTIMMDLS